MTIQDTEGYDLFRCAILERDADAWAEIHRRYQRLMISWACRCANRFSIGEQAHDIADQAFARAWIALTPDRFAAFPSLAHLMSYLRMCVATTSIDAAREQQRREHSDLPLSLSMPHTPEDIVMSSIERELLWDALLALTTTPAERVVLIEGFGYGLKPQSIKARHPQLFPEVANVYVTKRNLFDRLRRNRDRLRVPDVVAYA